VIRLSGWWGDWGRLGEDGEDGEGRGWWVIKDGGFFFD
jgi:hypothetical protein